ncbi:MAG: helix-turn-helix domain-containing protein [Opitutaceae bacterium]|jgi:hypothetical protein|nr:helix-turn-helix domain-containing protein [Opitutaceae bacterium]
MKKLPKEFIAACKAVKAQRPRTVINHLLKHGQITTEELKQTYGYNHPPRAIRDVKEQGIPLERFTVKDSTGRSIAAYRFGDPAQVRPHRFDGRTALSKKIKTQLIEKYGCRCFIYLEEMSGAALQIDHRVPFEIAGETGGEPDPKDFMLLCGSANRAKSWSCEHCGNLLVEKSSAVCLTCYWAYPENYTHVATVPVRRLDLIWQGESIKQYERLKADATQAGAPIPDYVKSILASIQTNQTA